MTQRHGGQVVQHIDLAMTRSHECVIHEYGRGMLDPYSTGLGVVGKQASQRWRSKAQVPIDVLGQRPVRSQMWLSYLV